MSKVRCFEDLEVWQLAREICTEISELFLTTDLGRDYALRNQIDRASGSIMDNIAEGFERDGNKEFKQFLSIAKGSCGEVRSQVYRCLDRKYITDKEHGRLLNRTLLLSKKLGSFITYLQRSEMKGTKFK